MSQSTRAPAAAARTGRTAPGDIDATGLTAYTGFKLRIVQVLMFDAFYDRFGERGITTGAYSTLLALRDNPGVRQGMLAASLQVKRSHMTKLVDRLVADGLVQRAVPPDDRRSVTLELTATGRRLVDTLEPEVQAHDHDTTSALSATERRELWRLLDKLAADLRCRQPRGESGRT